MNRFVWPVILSTALLGGCTGGGDIVSRAVPKKQHINKKTKFSVAAYGVAASPRITTSKRVRKGGGRRQVGKPYKVKGRWYVPKEQPGYNKTGMASWYGPNFHGRLTANGEIYDQYALSAAHPTFPLPSYAHVTNLKNGHSVIVRVNDRGPFHRHRIIDLSARAAKLLDYQRSGVASVRVRYVGPAPLHGRDGSYLEASYRGDADAPVAVAAVSEPLEPAIRPSRGIPNVEPLDSVVTGSIGPSGAIKPRPDDPFLQELQAVEQNIDTGSTLAVRLNVAKVDNSALR